MILSSGLGCKCAFMVHFIPEVVSAHLFMASLSFIVDSKSHSHLDQQKNSNGFLKEEKMSFLGMILDDTWGIQG